MENKQTDIRRIKKANSCSLWNDGSLARLIKKREKTHIEANIRNEKDSISYPADIQRMVLKLYATNMKWTNSLQNKTHKNGHKKN